MENAYGGKSLTPYVCTSSLHIYVSKREEMKSFETSELMFVDYLKKISTNWFCFRFQLSDEIIFSYYQNEIFSIVVLGSVWFFDEANVFHYNLVKRFVESYVIYKDQLNDKTS